MESFLVAGRGFFIALRRRIVVCRASIHSARHTPCFVRSRGAKRILNPFGLLAPDLRVIASRPSPSCVVSRRLGTLASPHSHFGRHRKRKTILNRFSFTNPTSYARRHNPKDKSYRCASMRPKRKGSTMCYLFFLVAGRGFEPPDLRVMSPTSYQAALPRDI